MNPLDVGQNVCEFAAAPARFTIGWRKLRGFASIIGYAMNECQSPVSSIGTA